MGKYYYSADSNVFIPTELVQEYLNARTFPEDAVLIADEISEAFLQLAPQGKMRVAGEDGMPAWVDIPPLTQEKQIEIAGIKCTQLRQVADSEVEWRQDAVDADIATDAEKKALAEWKTYRVLLMRVDTAAPVWPVAPAANTN